MAKILFIALALLVALVAGQGIGGVCRPQGCVARGAVCDTDLNVNLTTTTRERYCKGDDFCKIANRTTDITGICTAKSEVGGACSADQPCEDDLQCVNKFCNRGYYPGAKCKVANDCLYVAENGDQTAVCNNGRCAGIAAGAKCRSPIQSCLPPNVCGTDLTCVAAVGAGSACVADAHCQIGTYCNGGTCANRIAAGGACTLAPRSVFNPVDSQCVFRYACVPNAQSGTGSLNGTCKETFTATSGSVCVNTLDCAGGLACLTPPAGSAYGACGPVVSSSRRSCNGTSNADITAVCAANEGCVCNDNTGAGSCYTAITLVANKGGKGALNSASGCVEKCSRTDWNCLAKCEGKICNLYSKLLTATEKTNNLLTCTDDDSKSQLYPGYVACSTGSFVQFSLIGLVAVVAALLF